MTALTIHHSWTSPTLRNAMVVRRRDTWTYCIDAIAMVFRPLAVTLGLITAAVMWPAHAHADGLGDSLTSTLNSVGIGNNGPISTALAGIGQSICPMLVQPGSTFASTATQMTGQTGLAPTIAGFVASTAIQMECPSWMTSLANGEMPAGLQTLTSMAGPALGLGGAAPASPLPFALPGVNPVAPAPFTLPGANPVASTGLQIPGL